MIVFVLPMASQVQVPTHPNSPGPAGVSNAGQQLFSSNCGSCHGLDGHGGEHAPNIATNPDIQRLTDEGLEHIVRNGIPAAGMPGFGATLGPERIKTVVAYLRVLQGQGQNDSLPGDPVRGRALFSGNARCSQCHMVNGMGGFLGADLTGYGRTHSPAAVREAIVNPDKDFDPRHGAVTVVMKNGEKFTGLVRNEDNFSLQIQTTDGTFHLFDKAKLMHVDRLNKSLMPSYGKDLTNGQLDDIISFLSKAPGTPAGQADEDEE